MSSARASMRLFVQSLVRELRFVKRVPYIMKLPALLILFASVVSLYSSTPIQTKLVANKMPEEIMNAEFVAVANPVPIVLGAHKSRVTVLAVWTSWCEPCRLAITALKDVRKDFASQDVEVVGLTTEDPVLARNEVRAFLDENKINFENGWLDTRNASVLMSGRNVIPQIFVFTTDGTLVKRFIGWNQQKTLPGLRDAVKEALADKQIK
jgi:thiol-disulfide isomerase/thioredoxin